MMEKCKAVLNGLTMENATEISTDLLNLMHRYPKRVELITYVVTRTASSDMSIAGSCASMLKHFETISKKSRKFMTSMKAYIGTFFNKWFGEPCSVGGEPSDDENISNMKKIRFLCELYRSSVIQSELVLEIVKCFLKVDTKSNAAVNFACIVLKAVGMQLEAENLTTVNLNFEYFKYAVSKSEETTFLFQEYTKLIQYRKHGWKALKSRIEPVSEVQPEEPKAFVINFDDLGSDEYLFEIRKQIRHFVRKYDHAKVLIEALFTKTPTDFKSLSGVASLIKQLSCIYWIIPFAEIVYNHLIEVFVETSEMETLDNATEKVLIRLVVIVSELFHRNLIDSLELGLWLQHRHLNQLPLEVLVHISDIISSNLKAAEDKDLSETISLFNATINEKLSATFAEVHTKISELGTLILARIKAKRIRRV